MSLTGTDLVNTDYTHSFQIQEFRRPEFEVTARNESPGPYLSAKPATVAVNAAYYSGGPLGAAPVKWQVTTAAGSYSPPGWDQFTFGIWTPWWIYGDYGGYRGGGYLGGDVSAPCCIPVTDGGKVEQFSGTTDAAGNHYLKIDFGSVDGEFPDLPVTVSAQATVTDVNRQAWSSTTNVLVHPGEFYVGLRSDRTFVKQGDPLNIEAIVTDIDGKIAAGRPVKILAERLGYTFENGTWDQRVVADESCDITSGTEAATCTFATAEGGEYRITATIADDHGGRSRTQLTRWVSGGDAVPTRGVEQQQATIIPDKASYAPGDTAELLVQAPFAGQGLMTLTHHGIISTSRFEVVGGSAVLTVPIDDALVPNVDVNIEVVGITPRTADNGAPLPDAPPRPAYAVGQLSLRVEPTTRTLAVTATPADPELTPGTSTKVDVTVKDPAGAPVQGAEFAIVVVDEAVLALTNYGLPSPLDVFYQQNPTYLNAQYGRAGIVLANPAALTGEAQAIPSSEAPAATDAASAVFDAPALTVAAATTAAPSAAASESQKASAPADRLAATSGGADASNAAIDVRTNFDALAVFQPSVTTDANGAATVDVPLPDNLTRYRVMVVAASGDNLFGSAQSNITARLPLGVRPSAPRFLNFGDAFELPVVLQNQTDAAMDVDVALQAANLAITGAAGKHVSIPANDRIEVRFPVLASQAGTARFRVAAVSTAGDADAATVELPVYTPATTEAFATYGVIDDGAAAQPLLAPTGVVPQFGGLDVTTSSTALAGLTDAVIYISNYPYESSDAWASQIMSIASLKDVLAAFDAPGVSSPEALNAAVEDAIGHLVALQNDDGGFGFWERYRPSEPYNTVQVAHALVLAKKAGYTVPDQMLGRVMDYVRNVENYYPAAWGDDIRDFVSAYAINVRTQNDDRDVAKAQDLWNRRGDKLQLDTVALLWPSIDDQATDAAIEKLFNNRAVDTAGAAHFTTSYGDGASQILNSDRRTDGMILDSLVSKRPTSDLIPKVVTGLLDHRTAGRWDNIQENAFILLALKKYFDTFEKVTPDFVARVWLGDRYAGAGTFQGRSTDRANISIPTSELVTTGNTSLVLGKEGTGRLYYRIGLRYAPESLHLDPLDRGFVVERTYEGADDPADVTRDPDGTWRIKAGARVRVRLTMVAESQRAHVALVDHLPAGLEILNPALATTPALPPDSQGGVESTANGAAIDAPFFSEDSFWWYGTWFDHQNLRDDRAEAFSALLPAGTYDYSYVAKATTPGTFIAPPTKAEEIYAPETFGRTSTSKVIVTP